MTSNHNRNNTKSSLHLKFFDMQFLRLDQDRLPTSINNKYSHRNRTQESKSINSSILQADKPQNTTQATHMLNDTLQLENSLLAADNITSTQLKHKLDSIHDDKKKNNNYNISKISKKQFNSSYINSFQKQNLLAEKYKAKIKQTKQQNKKIHKDIQQLYRNYQDSYQHINQKNIKKVSKIQVFKNPSDQNRRISQQYEKQKLKLNKFYENLHQGTGQDSRAKLIQIQGKMKNSLVAKKFEQYLMRKNMRIPRFLSQLKD